MLLKEEKEIKGAALKALSRRHVYTIDDLAKLGPRHYYDYRDIHDISKCQDGFRGAFSGTLIKLEKRRMPSNFKRKYIFARVQQLDGSCFNVMFFGALLLFENFSKMVNLPIVVAGKISVNEDFGATITNPDIFELQLHFKPLIYKKYTKLGGVPDEKLKEMIQECLSKSTELLEPEVLEKANLPNYVKCLYDLHYPTSFEDIAIAKKRILYNDLIYFAMCLQQSEPVAEKSLIRLKRNGLLKTFVNGLPYELTTDQKECINRVIATSQAGRRNNVLLQGDVGTGKTVVAASLMICAVENGYQAVLMAPRTVLARQHYQEISGYAEKLGLTAVFLHAGMKGPERKEAKALIESGKAHLIIGTHSCLGNDIKYYNLGIMITDEEHLFGVNQKERIKEKAGQGLHTISMSATPIPRTLAAVLYGDSKEILCIKTKPAGRKEIITGCPKDREKTYRFMLKEIRHSHQCYVVAPSIEDEEDNSLVSVEALEKEYKRFFEPLGVRVGVVHGKMKPEDAAEAIRAFSANETQILISTTVIEVGVNVPNATIMCIEQAERFGLASLHQLRGRVGRSSLQSYCFLMSEEENNERLSTMCETNDGFLIAEADLKQRGSGNLIGSEQAGVNQYITLMLQYPNIYKKAKEIASFCLENGYGKKLFTIYSEHEDEEE